MGVLKDVNSYVSLAEANVYFEDRLDVSAWTDADEDLQAKALVTARMVLDQQGYTGTVHDEDQPLAFPRLGRYHDPRLGTVVQLGVKVPKRILDAQCEQAHHLLNNDGLLDDSGKVSNLAIGPIQLDNIQDPSVLPSIVKRLIQPLLKNGGSRLVWRAN